VVARGYLLTAADVARCAHRVALDRGFDVELAPEERSTEIAKRMRDASDHRVQVFAKIRELHPGAVDASHDAATLEAMNAGAEIILQARLVEPAPATRLASSDLLIKTSQRDEVTYYAPVIIKFNEITESASTRRLLEGSLANLSPESASWLGGLGVRRNDTMLRNGFALCHTTRVLESLKHADPLRRGGLIDRQARLWWFDLASDDCGRWNLARYDEAYAERLDVLRGHQRWREEAGPFPTVPFWHRECPNCPYHELCESQLEDRDDVSLIRFTSLDQQVLLRDHGVTTRAGLAGLDPERARAARTRSMVAVDANDVEVHLGKTIDKLDELIYRARAAVRATPLRIVEADALSCPTADVEVDVDMESYNETTYLWGALVTTRRDVPGVTQGYVSFGCFDHLDHQAEASIFQDFWTWFSQLRDSAHAAGASFAAYCFWAQAEDGAMNRAAGHSVEVGPTRDALESFRHHEPPEWVDLHEVAKRQIQTDGPLGLKVLAKCAGFSWRDENPSGEASMTWYEEATASSDDLAHAARQRILEYNEDDCRATYALRAWLNGPARELPHRDERP
jgi:predicted RecB family nuclease